MCNRLATVHQRYRQTGQTERHTGQRPDSVGRTVLQTVAQKRLDIGDKHVLYIRGRPRVRTFG